MPAEAILQGAILVVLAWMAWTIRGFVQDRNERLKALENQSDAERQWREYERERAEAALPDTDSNMTDVVTAAPDVATGGWTADDFKDHDEVYEVGSSAKSCARILNVLDGHTYSINTLVAQSGYAESTVRNAISALLRLGLIQKAGTFNPTVGRPKTRYEVSA